MDDAQRIVKCGSLALHTPGGFFKKRWHSKYLVLYDGSKSGVKRLELFESEIKYRKQSPVKIIPLVDCVRIVTCQRHKTTFTFEVRTNDQCYLLASKSFLDMNEWVNCLRLVAFGQQPASNGQQQSAARLAQQQTANTDSAGPSSGAFPATQAASFSSSRSNGNTDTKRVDVLLSRPQPSHAAAPSSDPAGRQQQVSAQSNGGLVSATSRFGQTAQYGEQKSPPVLTASQAAAAAASALAKSRQRQPSLLGSCKPQPPNDSPFIQQNSEKASPADNAASEARTSPFSVTSGGQVDTLTPTVRGQLIAAATTLANQSISSKPFSTPAGPITSGQATPAARAAPLAGGKALQIGATLDEEEENMLYCSIEDNPSEHNYRVKVIETELALRCQLKCYQLTATTTISQQYEELSQLRSSAKMLPNNNNNGQPPAMVTFYQLIIGPQELTLLNDYAASYSPMRTLNRQQQGLWSWPYQCIRRYGFDKDNCFMFEAGRKCTSGPGQFIVQTPKAYNIYQDVVKFVNELRTISSMGQPAALTQSPACDSMLAPHQLSKQMIVTQIPVTWAPHNNNNNSSNINNNNVANNNNSASRDAAREKQFFEALRRLDRPLPASPGEGAPASHLLESTDINRNNLASKLCDSVGRPTTEPPSNSEGDQRQPVNEAAKQEATIVDQQQQSASISSSASEETDESGYEQGDESVDSGPLAEQQGQARDRQQAAGQSGPKRSPVKTAASRLAGSDHYSTMSSSASSASPSSSASNSPGQSISRRTADLLSQKGASNDRPKPVLSQRPRLPLLHEITKVPSKTAPVKANPVQKSPQTHAARTSSSLHNLLATSCLANDAITVQGADQASAAKSALSTRSMRADEDFETNLMRDVYSEISKLHAKFAVTTAAGEDSMSSGGESVVASSSSENNTAGNEDEASREGDYDSMEGGQDCEPTYSNLRPADSERASRLGLNDSQPQRPVEHFQRGPAGHHPAHFLHDHARPPPLYPTMLNPIPEIAEHQPAGDGRQTAAERLRPAHYNNHHLEQAAEQQRRDSDHRTNKDGLPRARLALNRAAIKKQTMGPSSPAQNKRPTNHYLINDVPYAKISRDASPPPSQDKLRSAQRRA